MTDGTRFEVKGNTVVDKLTGKIYEIEEAASGLLVLVEVKEPKGGE